MTADPSPRGAAPPADGPLAGRDTPPRNAMPLRGTTESLAAFYDVALLDLDGVVYLGGSPIPGAADALAKAAASGMRLAFVTNNASRTPSAIAAQLTGLGVPARADEVITSAQAAARLAAEHLPAGATVLVVGGMGLRIAVRETGVPPGDHRGRPACRRAPGLRARPELLAAGRRQPCRCRRRPVHRLERRFHAAHAAGPGNPATGPSSR